MKNFKDKKALEELRWRLERFSTGFEELKVVCDFALVHLDRLKRARKPQKTIELKALLRELPISLDLEEEGIFPRRYTDELQALNEAIIGAIGTKPVRPFIAPSAGDTNQ